MTSERTWALPTIELLRSDHLARLQAPAALLLQMLHPLVAAGVMTTGRLAYAPVDRLRHTSAATKAIFAGDQQVIGRVRRIHERIRGTLPETAGKWPAGTPFQASEPHLLLWVFATLVETRIEACRALHGPVPHSLRELYYSEQRPNGERFGIPAAELPPDYAAFRDYYREMLASVGGPYDNLAVTPAATTVADAVLGIRIRGVPIGPVGKVAAAALMPSTAHRAYRLSWGLPQRTIWRTGLALMRFAHHA